jgi:predicted nucleic acid-binding protein
LTFFVDANILIYGAVPSPYRDPCLEILEGIAGGEIDGRTSTAVLEEIWWVELSGRAGRLEGLTQRSYTLFSPLLPVTDDAFRLALGLSAPQLGSNDRVHVGTCLAHGIEVVVSADAGFDGVPGTRRVDPMDRRAVKRLLSTGA